MGVALRAILAVLALGPLAVLGNFDTVSFSPVEQCGAFNVSFGGGVAPDALPLILTVIPFNASPIYIQIPEDSWNATSATGAAITFLPLAAGTNFLASLDDAYGQPTGVNTSDVILVGSSSSNDSSCLDAITLAHPSTFAIEGEPSQCEGTVVTFNSSTVTSAPSVRAFVPLGPSFELSPTNSTSGEADYLMNITRGTQVALLFDGGSDNAQTSDLLTVFGDTSSPTSCLATSAASTTQPLGDATTSSGSLSSVYHCHRDLNSGRHRNAFAPSSDFRRARASQAPYRPTSRPNLPSVRSRESKPICVSRAAYGPASLRSSWASASTRRCRASAACSLTCTLGGHATDARLEWYPLWWHVAPF
ncbi:hypothetical protein PENSPDRAFT_64701 [Peniophora sp. CONT]|nr:hypothetical protein PENSPDRAFT_64701 [Peniophora sp. CONT]